MNWTQFTELLLHFLMLSLLAVGGAITTAPDMHRYLVQEKAWITDAQFTSSIAIAQAAPGPNVIFIPLLGWQTGMSLGGTSWAALAGLCATLIGIMVPSSTLTMAATRWLHRNPQHIAGLALKASLAPISIALLIATSWLLGSSHSNPATDWPLWLLSALSLLLIWRTKLHLLVVLGLAALLGALGWV
jgi:chromate transporter